MRELDRSVQRHIDPQFGLDTVFIVLEDAVAEAVPSTVRASAGTGLWRHRPEMPGFFVTYIDGLATGVGERVVMPGAQTKFVSVFHPGIGAATFGNHRAEVRVGQHVGPWRRCRPARLQVHHVLAAISAEAAVGVAQEQTFGSWQGGSPRRLWLALERGDQRRVCRACVTAMNLFGNTAVVFVQHQARHRQDQRTILVRQLLCRTYENASGTVDQRSFAAGCHHTHDQVLKLLAIAGLVFVPDDEVHHQALLPPVSMGLDHLMDKVDVFDGCDLQQNNGQVPGYRLAPQARLITPIGHQYAIFSAQRGIGIEDRRGHLFKQACIFERYIELAQQHLAVGPGQVEDAIGEVPVAVFIDQIQTALAAVRDTGHQVDGRCLPGVQCNTAADCHDRVEHRACGAGQLLDVAIERRRCCNVAPSADESCSIGLVGNGFDIHTVGCQQVAHPGYRFLTGARPAGADDCLQRWQQFGLHEQVAEGRVHCITDRRRQYHLGVGGDLHATTHAGAVGDVQSTQFDVIFGGHDNFSVRIEIEFANAKLGPGIAENGFMAFWPMQGRLVGRGPVNAAGDIAQVAEHAPVVAGRVFTPTGHGDVVAAAVTAAGTAEHDVVMAVGQ
ncbi:hypothetical protein D9M71_97990 [compost metagenome]